MRRALSLVLLLLVVGIASADSCPPGRSPNLCLKPTAQQLLNDNFSRIDETLGGMMSGPFNPENNGKVFDRGGSEVNVKNVIFGATGDGVTNDTTALINASGVACATAAKHLHIPAGTYIVRDDVPLCSGLTVTMDAGAVLSWDTPIASETHGVFYGNGVSDVVIDCRGGVIRGTNTTATFDTNYQQNHGILFDTSDDNTVTHCTFENIYGNGALKLAYGSTSSNTSNRNRSIGNTFRRCAVYGFVVTSGSANESIGDTFEDCAAGVETNNTTNVVAQNHFVSPHFRKVLKTDDQTEAVKLGIQGRDSDDAGNTVTDATFDGGYLLISGAVDTVVTGGTAKNNSSTNVLRSPLVISGSAHRTRVSGFDINGATFAGAKTSGRGLATIVDSNDVSLTGITVVGNPIGHGVGFRNANRLTIANSRIRDNVGSGIMSYLTNDDLHLAHNDVIDNNTGNDANDFGIELDGDNGTTVTRPVVEGNHVYSPASDKQGTSMRVEWVAGGVFSDNVLAPHQGSSYSLNGTVTATVNGVPLTDAPNTCAADRNGDEYWDASLDERCDCNSSHSSGVRWCQTDGGGCTSDTSCG